jgi:acetylornithine/N-succinyldiaminopimelate aminotransferase
MEKAFHGRTMATLSATGNRKAQAGFEPLVSGFVRVPYNDLEAIKGRRAQQECRRGDARDRPGRGRHQYRRREPSSAAARAVRREGLAADLRRGAVRHGRTGKWFGFQHAGIQPDVMTLAKGLGSGVPIGACLTAGKAAGLFKPGNHGSTFGGNPLACTAALTTIDVIERGRPDGQRRRRRRPDPQGLMAEALAGVQGRGRHPRPRPDDRHRTRSPLRRTGGKALAAGLLINVTADKVVRLLPPLTFSENAEALMNWSTMLGR